MLLLQQHVWEARSTWFRKRKLFWWSSGKDGNASLIFWVFRLGKKCIQYRAGWMAFVLIPKSSRAMEIEFLFTPRYSAWLRNKTTLSGDERNRIGSEFLNQQWASFTRRKSKRINCGEKRKKSEANPIENNTNWVLNRLRLFFIFDYQGQSRSFLPPDAPCLDIKIYFKSYIFFALWDHNRQETEI